MCFFFTISYRYIFLKCIELLCKNWKKYKLMDQSYCHNTRSQHYAVLHADFSFKTVVNQQSGKKTFSQSTLSPCPYMDPLFIIIINCKLSNESVTLANSERRSISAVRNCACLSARACSRGSGRCLFRVWLRWQMSN